MQQYQVRDQRLKNLGYDSYQDYLLSDHWKRTRKWLFYSGYVKREDSVGEPGKLLCTKCQVPVKPPYVHHKTYQNLGHEPLTDLEVLCYDCHSRVHNK